MFAETEISLIAYPDDTENEKEKQVLLIIPAPIKQAYIWDLIPTASVVRQCLSGNLKVFKIKWGRPESRMAPMGLEDYADRLIMRCLKAC